MKLDSKLFDRIRVKPARPAEDRTGLPPCAWPGCHEAGSHRAPMGRGREGQYHHFCLSHVRLYNQSYDYFAGMSDAAVAAFQRDAVTGHRPTWRMGVDAPPEPHGAAASAAAFAEAGYATRDPFEMFGPRRAPPPPPEPEPRRRLTATQRRAFDVMDLDETASPPAIKARYKTLVKRHHPDANGGDRSSEERLRHVIQAYGVLKGAGFC